MTGHRCSGWIGLGVHKGFRCVVCRRVFSLDELIQYTKPQHLPPKK